MNPKQSSEEIRGRIFRNVEAGDLMLYEVQQEVIALFGNTKAGKTTSSHYLCNSNLESVDVDGNLHWHLMPDNKHKTALIGVTSDSQTEIPNLLSTQIKIKDQKIPVVIMDMPGYQDNFGFNRIYSNAYFHYRAFSKIKSAKFIITFAQDEIGKKQMIKKIIQEFTLSFKDFAKEEEDILKATMFLVTKVSKTKTLENIVGRFHDFMNTLKNVTKDEGDMYKRISQHMINQKKVFIIHAPNRGGEKTAANSMLLEMYKATQFWKRDSNKTIVDMSKIHFSITDLIFKRLNDLRDSTFLPEFKQFCDQMKNRFDQFMFLQGSNGSLVNLIKTIATDAFSQNWAQATFMSKIKDFVKQKSYFLDTSSKDLVNKRERAQNFLFDKKTTTTGLNVNKLPYFILKFEVLKSIVSTALSLSIQMDKFHRNEMEFERISEEIKSTFSALKRLSPKPEQTPIIVRYCYLLQRVIEESIITSKTIYSDKEKIGSLANIVPDFHTEDISVRIYDVWIAISELYPSKQKFIEEFDTTKLDRVTHECIQFFDPEQQDKINQLLSLSINPILSVQEDSLTNRIIRATKFAEILTKYQTQYLQQAGENSNDIKKGKSIVLKLINCRHMLCYMHEEKCNPQIPSKTKKQKQLVPNQQPQGEGPTEESIVDSILEVTKAAGRILLKLREYSFAREVYQSIGCVTQVLRAFDSDLAQASKQGRSDDYLRILKEAGEYASVNMQNQRALRYFQEAYDVCRKYKEREKIIQRQIALTAADSLTKFQEKMKKKVQFEKLNTKAIEKILKAQIEQLQSPLKLSKVQSV